MCGLPCLYREPVALVDVNKRMNFYANTDASSNKTCSLLLGNGGVDSVNAAIVLSSSRKNPCD